MNTYTINHIGVNWDEDGYFDGKMDELAVFCEGDMLVQMYYGKHIMSVVALISILEKFKLAKTVNSLQVTRYKGNTKRVTPIIRR